MNLDQILAVCQSDQADRWRVVPHGWPPATDLLHGLIDAGQRDAPALTVLHHLHHAVYVPDPRIAIGFGMPVPGWMDRAPSLDWAEDRGWSGIEAQYAHIVFSGAMVWRVLYVYVNAGAGVDGTMPWSQRAFEEGPDPLRKLPMGWDISRWELEFVHLLHDLKGSRDFDYEAELGGFGLRPHDRSPLEEGQG